MEEVHIQAGKGNRPAGELLALIVIFLGASFLHLYRLEEVPPGLHFDEAVYGLMAKEIAEGGRPIFFSAYTGREPLYMYLVALTASFTGLNAYALRLTAALIGLTLVLTAYLTFRELYSPRLGLLTAAFTAISYWHLTFSRIGYPRGLVSLLQVLAILFLWRGYREGRRSLLAVGGFWTGAILYTYLSARLFPPTLMAIAALALFRDRPRFQARLGGLALGTVVALVVAIPLGYYAYSHPQAVWERSSQVSILSETRGLRLGWLILRNAGYSLGCFLWKGDPRWHWNFAGKPVFDPLVGALAVAGLGLVLARRRRLEYAMLPLWLAGMALPGVLTSDAQPAGHRLYGMAPAVFALPALTVDAGLAWLERRRPRMANLGLAAVALFFIGEGAATFHIYFHKWAPRYEVYYIFNTDYALLAERASQELAAGRTVLLASEHYKHPTIAFLAPQVIEEAIWFDPAQVAILPNRPKELVVLLPASYAPPQSPAGQFYASLAKATEAIPGPFGPAATLYRLRSPGLSGPSPLTLTLHGEVEVIGSVVPAEAPRDRPLALSVDWRVLKEVAAERRFAVHLVDKEGLTWAQADAMGYLWVEWQPGDLVRQWFTLNLERRMPAGQYEVRLILADGAAQPLPALDSAGRLRGTYISLGSVRLTPSGGLVQPVKEKAPALGHLRVMEWQGLPARAGPGERLTFAITWQKAEDLPGDPKVIFELQDGQGRTWARFERPLAGEYPASQWQVGEEVQGRHTLALPADAPAGPSTLWLSLEGTEAGLMLGKVEVEATPRLFSPPPIQYPLHARLGEDIELLGYALPRGAKLTPGGTLPLVLYWRALGPVEGSFKVFTHLLDEGGVLRGQKDGSPAGGRRPTSGWAKAEVIVDEYAIPLSAEASPGKYLLEIGMYHAETLERLPAWDEAGRRLDQDRIILTGVEVTSAPGRSSP